MSQKNLFLELIEMILQNLPKWLNFEKLEWMDILWV